MGEKQRVHVPSISFFAKCIEIYSAALASTFHCYLGSGAMLQ